MRSHMDPQENGTARDVPRVQVAVLGPAAAEGTEGMRMEYNTYEERIRILKECEEQLYVGPGSYSENDHLIVDAKMRLIIMMQDELDELGEMERE